MKLSLHPGIYCVVVFLQFSVLCAVLTPDQDTTVISGPCIVHDESDLIHLKWRDLGKDVVYHFQMSTDKDFTQLLVDQCSTRPEISIPYPEASGQYYVRTKPIFPDGGEGSFSLPQRYRIKSALQPSRIIEPREIREYRGVFNLTIRWDRVPRASGYHVLLARDRAFECLIRDAANVPDTVLDIKHLDYGTYFLKISTIARDGTEGVFSDVRRFVIAPPRPGSSR
ncbi:MAG: hypothetical protein ACOYVJ_10805 [Nitrospirota bacterium]